MQTPNDNWNAAQAAYLENVPEGGEIDLDYLFGPLAQARPEGP